MDKSPIIVKTVNIAELKNNLSLYLKKVRRGEEIIVRDRNLPVAKLVPWTGENDDQLLALIAEGLVRAGSGHIGDDFWQLPAPRVSENALRAAILEEREDA